jgi:HEPN/Toprim N-terminal domain 1
MTKSSYTDVRIGGLTYGGSQQGRYDPQISLFNSNDLKRIGMPGDAGFQHVYRISVGEMRRRLELLGYTVEAIRCNLVDAIRPLYASLSRQPPEIPYRAFLDFACGSTAQDLIKVVRDWRAAEERRRGREPTLAELEKIARVNTEDFPAALLDLLWGGSPFLLPGGYLQLHELIFERLLCEVFDDETPYELDMTEVMRAGYFKDEEDPVGNAFDTELGLR